MNSETPELQEKLLRAEKTQGAMLQIASLSSQVQELSSFYDDLQKIINQLMYAENFYIALLSDDKKFVNFEYFKDIKDELDASKLPPEPIKSFKKTLTGYILDTGQALLSDIDGLYAMVDKGLISLRGEPSAYWMGVPLVVDNTTIGVMVIQSYLEDVGYDEQDKDVLSFVALQIAAVLQQKRYEHQLREYNESLERKVIKRTAMLEKINKDLESQIEERKRSERLQAALFKISELTNTTHDINEFYQAIHKIINGVMPSKNFLICTYQPQSHTLQFPYVVDQYDADLEERSFDINKPLEKCTPAEWIIRSGQSLLLNQTNRSEWVASHSSYGTPATTWLGAPLFEKNICNGLIAIQSYQEGDAYTRLDEEILLFVAQQVSTALERKKAAQSLQAAHEELKQANNELEQRVEQRTHELSVTNNTLKTMLDERNKMQKKLAHEAMHDSLTGLPNRALFTDRLKQTLRRMERDSEIHFAVLFLDLDRFKVINDSLGHVLGDALLQQVAIRLKECVRPEDTVARLGGDEFCILLNYLENPRDAANTANRIIEYISQPFHLGDQNVFTSTSIGVTFSNNKYSSPEDVLRDADAAMYHAKETGKARYALFDVEMHNAAMKRLKIENDLRIAIANNEIVAYYQPIIDIQKGSIIAFEALARWEHAELGFVSPDEFIPIAEETGMIHEIGRQILDQSFATLKQWRKKYPKAKDISVSVNFSSRQIEQHDLIEDIDFAIDKHNIENQSLKVEITEGLLIENEKLAQKLLKKLHDRGISVLLDDFGTGYSSLSYLHKFILHTLKIDRSFVHKLDNSPEHETIVKTVAFMCKELNLDLIAEGVEYDSHVSKLLEMDIQYAQGYFFSRPVNGDEAGKFIDSFSWSH